MSDIAALRCTSSHYNRVFSDSCYWKRRAKMYLNVWSAPNVAWHDDPIGTFQQLYKANDNILRSYSALRKQLRLLEEREILVGDKIDNLRTRICRLNCCILALDS